MTVESDICQCIVCLATLLGLVGKDIVSLLICHLVDSLRVSISRLFVSLSCCLYFFRYDARPSHNSSHRVLMTST